MDHDFHPFVRHIRLACFRAHLVNYGGHGARGHHHADHGVDAETHVHNGRRADGEHDGLSAISCRLGDGKLQSHVGDVIHGYNIVQR